MTDTYVIDIRDAKLMTSIAAEIAAIEDDIDDDIDDELEFLKEVDLLLEAA